MRNTNQSYEVERDVVERVTGSSAPYFVFGRTHGLPSVFGLCPHCENPIQLKGLHKEDGIVKPYGSHLNDHQEGLPNIDWSALRRCPCKRENRQGSGIKLPPSPADNRILNIVREEFDRIVSILNRMTGVYHYTDDAEAVLRVWFDEELFRFSRVSFTNVPWMMLYGRPSFALFGKVITSKELRAAIVKSCSGAEFTNKNRLIKKNGGKFFDLQLQSLEHKYHEHDREVFESIGIRVTDTAQLKKDGSARTVWETRIEFGLQDFDNLMRRERGQQSAALLAIARKILGE